MPRPKTIHGIDPYAPGGIEELLNFHRARWGDMQMNANAGGEAGAGTGESGETGENGGETGTQQTTGEVGETNTQGEQGKAESQSNIWDDPAKAKAEIERLRGENAKDRTTAKTKAADEARNSLVQELGKALGLVKDGDKKPSPDELAKQVTEQATAAKQAQTELAVYKLAGKHGADADALLDSRAFLAKIAEIDHTKTADVEKAIKEAVESNPKLKSVRVAGSSTADGAGGSGEKAKKNTGLGDALAGHYATN